jgi:hypothetical protein
MYQLVAVYKHSIVGRHIVCSRRTRVVSIINMIHNRILVPLIIEYRFAIILYTFEEILAVFIVFLL